MALDIEQVATVVFVFSMPKMIEASTKHVSQGSKRTNMTTQVAAVRRIVSIGFDHHGHGVPTHISTQAFFNLDVAWAALFLIGFDGVDIPCVGRERHVNAVFTRMLEQLL